MCVSREQPRQLRQTQVTVRSVLLACVDHAATFSSPLTAAAEPAAFHENMTHEVALLPDTEPSLSQSLRQYCPQAF